MRKAALSLLSVLILVTAVAVLGFPFPSVSAQVDATPLPETDLTALETRVAALEQSLSALTTRVAELEKPTPTATRGPERGASALPTATPRPTRQPAASNFEILSIDSRVTESNSTWWKYAWILEVSNQGDEDIVFNAEIQFQDEDGFVIDTANAYSLVILAGETKKFSDYILISTPGAASVEKIYAQTRITN
jgi:hypothetical protein